jgi:aconitate hydratase
MLASRQLMGTMARSRTLASLGIRRMATVSDSPLDKKVSLYFSLSELQQLGAVCLVLLANRRRWEIGQAE